MICYIVGLILKFNWTFDGTQNLYFYLFASSWLFAASFVAEIGCIALLPKVISPTLSAGLMNAGFVSGLADTGGRMFGSIIISVFALLGGPERLCFYLYLFYGIILTIFLVLIIIWYDELQKLVYVQVVAEEAIQQ